MYQMINPCLLTQLLSLLVLVLVPASCISRNVHHFSPFSPELQYIGRFSPSKQFDMPGTEIRATFQLTGNSSNIKITLSQKNSKIPKEHSGNTINSHFQGNAFVVYINDKRQGKGAYNASFSTDPALRYNNKTHDFALNDFPLAKGIYTVRILKVTEAQWNAGTPTPNYITFHGFQIESTSLTIAPEKRNTLISTSPSPILLSSPPLPKRKIEFLGDSITAGFCNLCQYNSSPIVNHDESYGMSWDYQIGQLLNAQVHTAAWSGFGLIHNCCGGNTTMPSIFTRTLATFNMDNTWNYTNWLPNVLVINLGTNDGTYALKDQYTLAYIQLIQDVYSKYYNKDSNNDFHIFLACGPMTEIYCQPVFRIIHNMSVVSPHINISFLDQRGFLNGSFGKACCGHPSIHVDTAMAKSGATIIGNVMGWL